MSYNIPISECPPTACCTGEPGNVTGRYYKGMRIRLISTCMVPVPPTCAGTVFLALSGTSYNTWTDLITAINGTGILPVTITPSMDAVAVAAIFWANEAGTAFDFDLDDYLAGPFCHCEEMITYSACCDVGCCYITGCTNDRPGPHPGWNPATLDWSLCNNGTACLIPGPGCCGGNNGYASCNFDSTSCCDCNGDTVSWSGGTPSQPIGIPVGPENPGWSACCCTVVGCTDPDSL